jgi:GT2 family glycosyltransferase
MLMDNDITYKPDCIPRLLQQLRLHPNALSCRPRLVYANQPDVIYQDAASLHYLAVSAGQIRDQPVSEGLKPYPRQTIGGGIMLLNCAIARDLGNFDENYLFGWSDGELDMRARLLGFVALQDPYAVAYHIERAGSLRRVVGQLYNRRRLILICYSARSLVVLGPALLLFEIVTFLMCLMSRYGKQYWEAWRLLKRDFRDIRSRRQELQSSSRRLGDRVVLTGGSISITGRMAGSRVVLAITPILSGFFWLYWKLTGPLIQGQNDLPELASSQPVQDQAQ